MLPLLRKLRLPVLPEACAGKIFFCIGNESGTLLLICYWIAFETLWSDNRRICRVSLNRFDKKVFHVQSKHNPRSWNVLCICHSHQYMLSGNHLKYNLKYDWEVGLLGKAKDLACFFYVILIAFGWICFLFQPMDRPVYGFSLIKKILISFRVLFFYAD